MTTTAIQAASLWWREITRFRRQRSVIIGSLVQPLIFWVLIGWGFNASFRPSGMPHGVSYVQYFYPGVIMLVLLFTAIFSTIQTVEDRQEGFLQGVLVAPISRATVVFGQALGGTTLALIQGLIFLALAPAAGIWLSAGAIGAAAAIMIVTAFALTSIGLIIAWRIESTRGFHLIMNSILVPIWFLSGAFFPAGGAPAWLGWIMRINPLTYQMAALRRALYLGHPNITGPIPRFSLTIPVSIVFAIAMFTLAAVVARRSTVA